MKSEIFNEYYMSKMVKHFLYNDQKFAMDEMLETTLNNDSEVIEGFISTFEEMIKEQEKNSTFDISTKKNAFEIVDYLLKIGKSRTRINKIICQINLIPPMQNDLFYQVEMNRRAKCLGYKKECEYPYAERHVKEIFCYDFWLLDALLLEEEEFKDEAKSEYCYNDAILYTYASYLLECPDLFKDEEFLSKLKYILKMNKKWITDDGRITGFVFRRENKKVYEKIWGKNE